MLKRPLRSLQGLKYSGEEKENQMQINENDVSGTAVNVDPLSSYQSVVFTVIDITQYAGRSGLIQIHENLIFFLIRNFELCHFRNFVIRELFQLGTLLSGAL